MQDRRHFIRTLGAVGVAAIAGCSQQNAAEIVNTYTEGYRVSEVAYETNALTGDAQGDRQSALYERASQLYSDAADLFEDAEILANGEAQSLCGEAKRHCNAKSSEAADYGAGNTTLGLAHASEAASHDIASPEEVQNAVGGFGNPGDTTVPTVTPAPVSASSTPTSTPQPTETATEEPTPTETEESTPSETEEPDETDETEEEPVPDFLGGLSGSTLPDPDNEQYHERVFTQSFSGGSSEYTIQVPDTLYQYYQSRPRIADYSAYLTDTFDEDSLQSIANTLESYGDEQGHSDRQIVNHAIAWIQGMQYTQDQPATGYNEYPKYPIETLHDRGGDCEDTSILLAGVLDNLGYGTRLLELPDAAHMAVGVAGADDLPGAYYTDEGTQYYYVETTGEGWRVGEVPESVQNQGSGANLIALDGAPSLAVEWESRAVPGELRVGLTIHNAGSQSARNVQGQIDVMDGSGNAVEQSRTSYATIPTDGNVTQELTLDVPTDRALQLRLGALLGGTLNDLDETDMHSP